MASSVDLIRQCHYIYSYGITYTLFSVHLKSVYLHLTMNVHVGIHYLKQLLYYRTLYPLNSKTVLYHLQTLRN